MDSTQGPHLEPPSFAPGTDLSSFSSPLDNFLNYVPKAHEQAIRQAIYNALALFIMLALGTGAYLVLGVLHPFTAPIFWAVLTGGFLHPYKSSVCQWVHSVLQRAPEADTPFVIDCTGQILWASILFCDALGDYLFSRWKLILSVTIGVPLSYALYMFQPALLLRLWDFALFLGWLPYSPLLDHLSLPRVALLWCLLFGALLFKESPGSGLPIKAASLATWMALGAYLSTLLWTPLLYVMLGSLGAFIIYNWTHDPDTPAPEQAEDAVDSNTFIVNAWNWMLIYFSGERNTRLEEEELLEAELNSSSETISPKEEEKPLPMKKTSAPPVTVPVIQEEQEGEEEATEVEAPKKLPTRHISGPDKVLSASTPSAKVEVLSQTPNLEVIRHPGVAALKQQHLRRSTPQFGPTPSRSGARNYSRNTSFARRRRYRNTTLPGPGYRYLRDSIELTEKPSTVYLRGVLYACIAMQFYKHPGLLHLLPVPISVYLVKRAVIYFKVAAALSSPWQRLKDWIYLRADVLAPGPVRSLARVLARAERGLLVGLLPDYVDPLVTTMLILLLILVVVVSSVFVSFELYAESAHMVQTSGRLVGKMANSSVFRQLNDSLWDPNVDNVLESAYHSGRDYIATNIHTLLGREEDEKAMQEIEDKVLELWDRMYQYWLSRRSTLSLENKTRAEEGPQMSGEAITTSVDEIVEKIMDSTDFFSYSSLMQFLKDNMDTVRAIVEQAWVLVQGNLRFVLTLALEILQLVANSGSGVVNIFLSIIVYFTALFYLLSNSSREVYKPVEVVSNHGHLFGEGFADALNKAASSIFSLTFRMAGFYGLWTYLTHQIFNVSVVMVPVLAATFLAAVPVAGQYLVAVPGALELWLASDRPIAALLLILVHFLPMMVVDAAIYGEVRRGIHPWLTGLSIVGGIYYFGIAGAILGPLLLCAVTVALSMYTGIMNDLPDEGSGDRTEHVTIGGQRSRLFATPVFKRSESVY